MEHNPDLDVDLLAVINLNQAEFWEQIRLSKGMIDQCQELLKQIDEMLAKSPLKP